MSWMTWQNKNKSIQINHWRSACVCLVSSMSKTMLELLCQLILQVLQRHKMENKWEEWESFGKNQSFEQQLHAATSTHCQVSSSHPLYSVLVSSFYFLHFSMSLNTRLCRFLFGSHRCTSRFFKSINFALRVSDSFAFTSAPRAPRKDTENAMNIDCKDSKRSKRSKRRPQRSTERNFWSKKFSTSFCVVWPSLVCVLVLHSLYPFSIV